MATMVGIFLSFFAHLLLYLSLFFCHIRSLLLIEVNVFFAWVFFPLQFFFHPMKSQFSFIYLLILAIHFQIHKFGGRCKQKTTKYYEFCEFLTFLLRFEVVNFTIKKKNIIHFYFSCSRQKYYANHVQAAHSIKSIIHLINNKKTQQKPLENPFCLSFLYANRNDQLNTYIYICIFLGYLFFFCVRMANRVRKVRMI